MKAISLFLACYFVSPLFLQAATIVVRDHKTKIDKYYQYLRQNVQNQTPMDFYENYYRQQAIAEELLKKVEKFKFDGSLKNFEKFKSMAFEYPPSSEKKNLLNFLQNKHAIPKQEKWDQLKLIKKIKELRQLPGGHDLALFIDGIRWMENQDIDSKSTYQWTLLSSTWSPIHLNGTGEQFVALSFEKLKNWINGDQNNYEWSSLDLLVGHHRQIFWGLDEISWDNGLEKHLVFQEQKIESEFIKSKWTWLGAVALGLLWHQHSKNKQLVISF